MAGRAPNQAFQARAGARHDRGGLGLAGRVKALFAGLSGRVAGEQEEKEEATESAAAAVAAPAEVRFCVIVVLLLKLLYKMEIRESRVLRRSGRSMHSCA